MNKKLETIEETAQQTAEKMKERNTSSLLVDDGKGKPLGLVTERYLIEY